MADKVTKETVSKRIPLDKHGEPQEGWLDAKGGNYKNVKTGVDHKLMFNEVAKPAIGALLFGALMTFAGNQTNSVRAGLRAGEDPGLTEDEAVDRFYQNLKEGNWTTPRGEVEAGISLLARAVARAKSQTDGKVRNEADIATLAKWLAADGVADENEKKATAKARKAGARSNESVKVAMHEIQIERAKAAPAAGSAALADIPG